MEVVNISLVGTVTDERYIKAIREDMKNNKIGCIGKKAVIGGNQKQCIHLPIKSFPGELIAKIKSM